MLEGERGENKSSTQDILSQAEWLELNIRPGN